MVGSENAERLLITSEKNEEDLIATRKNYDNVCRREIGTKTCQSLFYFYYIIRLYNAEKNTKKTGYNS